MSVSTRFLRLLNDYHSAVEACMGDELHNSDPTTLPSEQLDSEAISEAHAKELAAGAELCGYVHALEVERGSIEIELQRAKETIQRQEAHILRSANARDEAQRAAETIREKYERLRTAFDDFTEGIVFNFEDSSNPEQREARQAAIGYRKELLDK